MKAKPFHAIELLDKSPDGISAFSLTELRLSFIVAEICAIKVKLVKREDDASTLLQSFCSIQFTRPAVMKRLYHECIRHAGKADR